MRISVIHPAELGPAEVATWRSFQYGTDLLANPFLSPDFTIAVGRHRPGARVAVLEDDRDIIGFLPFERRRLGLGVPIAAGLTDLQGLVHAPKADWDPRALLRACDVAAWQFDHLVAGQKPFAPYQHGRAASPVIDLSRGYDAYYQDLKSRWPRFSRNLSRRDRKLEREVGPARFVLDAPDVTGLHTLMAWKSDQYQRTGRVDRFAQPWIVALLEDLLGTRNEHFSGLLSLLYAGDVPVAAHFGVRFGRTLSYWFQAYRTSFSVYSPGLMQTMRTIEGAAAQGVELVDLGKGHKRYKEELKSYDLTVAEGIVTRPSPLGAAQWARSVPTAWAIREIRNHESWFNAFDLVLKKGAAARRTLTSRRLRPARRSGGNFEPVHRGGGGPEHRGLLVRAQPGGQQLAGQRGHLGVAGREGANRPVGAEHQPSRAEAVQQVIHVGAERRGRRRRAGFGDQTGQLAGQVGQRGHLGGQPGPRLEPVLADLRLAAVIEHEPHIVQLGGHPQGGGQLSRADQQVVDQPGRADRAQAPAHVRPAEPVRVGLVLHQVPDADQPVAAGLGAQPVQLAADVVAGQVDPAHHPGHLGHLPRGGGRRGQELFRFRRAGQHLDEHAGRHPGGRALPGVVGQPERPAKPGQPVQPVVAPRRRIPQVVVGVDDHLVLLAELHGAARAVQRPLLRICYHKTAIRRTR